MTGCAAVILNCNARTLHSWSGIKLAKGPNDKIIAAVLKNRNAVKVWRSTKILILDEVSMLSKKIFEIIEELARIIRKVPLPFGGMQVIFTGDFYQLPPVGTDGDPDTNLFCFESPIWRTVFTLENHIQLKTIFRQTDPQYIEILQQIRCGTLSETNKQLLQTYVKREYDPAQHNDCIPTKLFPLRSKVDFVNTQMFSKIKEKEFIFEVVRKTDCITNLESGKPLNSLVLDMCSKITIQERDYELDQLINNTPCSQILRLKKGVAVMCTVNLDMDNSICNGSQGIVLNILENSSCPGIIVKFSNGIIKTITPHFWQSDDYPTIAIGQYPLCLAWALTIHKIQGATLEMAEIDIGQSVFEYGQTYVALSRIQSLNGLYLSAFHAQKIMANPIVQRFYEEIENYSLSSSTQTIEQNNISKNVNQIKTVRLC
jgi:ATP-dependent DNA helicase PIF1